MTFSITEEIKMDISQRHYLKKDEIINDEYTKILRRPKIILNFGETYTRTINIKLQFIGIIDWH